MREFNVGDRVLVVFTSSAYYGQEGVVVNPSNYAFRCEVKHDDGVVTEWGEPSSLDLVESARDVAERAHSGVETDPNGLSAKAPGAKLDSGKAPILRGVIEYFPRAVKAVASVSDFGAKKYSWGGWRAVPNGIVRYGDAMQRHQVGEFLDGPIDPETGLMHAAQTAWNAMARLELMLIEAEGKPA